MILSIAVIKMDRFEMFTSSVLKINRFVQKIKSFEIKEYNLKGTTVSCLYYLNHHNSLTSTELVKLCEEDKATISRALSELEKKNYITFDSSFKKKYNTKVFLTDEGKKVSNYIDLRVNNIFEICGNNLSDEERINFYNTLVKIANNIEEYVNKEVK